MASMNDDAFKAFAGQEVVSGVRANAPLIPFDGISNKTVLDNLALVGGLLPKCADVIIHDTKIFDNPLDPLFTKHDMPFGAYVEEASFESGAASKKNDGRCVPFGNVEMKSQMNIQNFAMDIPLSIYDREISKAVMDQATVGRYVAEKMKTPQKTLAQAKYSAMVQLLSNSIDGTRNISSHDSSDGTGSVVNYVSTVEGYAGKVIDSGVTCEEVREGIDAAFASSADAVAFVKALRGVSADMQYETDGYNKLGVVTHSKPSDLVCIMEKKVLNALDDALSFDTDGRFPSKTARDYIAQNVCPNIVEIGAFSAMPTSSSVTSKRNGAVLIDMEAMNEWIAYNDMEGQRCASQRRTGYSWQYESTMSIYRGVNSAVITFDTE